MLDMAEQLFKFVVIAFIANYFCTSETQALGDLRNRRGQIPEKVPARNEQARSKDSPDVELSDTKRVKRATEKEARLKQEQTKLQSVSGGFNDYPPMFRSMDILTPAIAAGDTPDAGDIILNPEALGAKNAVNDDRPRVGKSRFEENLPSDEFSSEQESSSESYDREDLKKYLYRLRLLNKFHRIYPGLRSKPEYYFDFRHVILPEPEDSSSSSEISQDDSLEVLGRAMW